VLIIKSYSKEDYLLDLLKDALREEIFAEEIFLEFNFADSFLTLRKEGQNAREMRVKMGERIKMGKIFV